MIAQVYLLKRLPRRFTFFDYNIPDHIKLNIGDLVRVPFKGRGMLGVVKNISEKSEFDSLLHIESIAIASLMESVDIERIESIASSIIQSPSTVLYAAFQGLCK
ncbi:hypothetical protein IH979_02875 [Patescibacteria group bacterium]|nr:hypothetical protein [Patescibacteria group bacterium]